ncbi:tetratricopeptide repeat protein [Streptomyces phaeochromogenes]|uniref:tetratricopeptide repeat protein n=1 Tax=Streptomyces phaeochromogenes TaxID=1923 RepID=UPI002DDAC43D|nr:tetratricopeptide repeat protein [Streptomyces phaeochromogenes]WRZ32107.1 tetratricopeptide repeat protein [Streptomyces phaeochromogenes]
MSEVPRTGCAETMDALREELQRAAEERSVEGLPPYRPVEEPAPADDLVSESERILADRERTLGADHPDTLLARTNVGGACQQAGHADRAVRLFEQILADGERVLGPDHPDILTFRNNLAGGHEAAGDPARAIPLYEDALSGRERVLGPDDLRTLQCRDNLARAHELTAAPTRAVPLHERTLSDRERTLGGACAKLCPKLTAYSLGPHGLVLAASPVRTGIVSPIASGHA